MKKAKTQAVSRVQPVYRDFLTDFAPRRFSDIIGQQEEVAMMKRWIVQKEIPKAILLSGGIGVGKTVLANLLRRSAACSSRPAKECDPCWKCLVCRHNAIWSSYSEIGSRVEPDKFREKVERARCGGVKESFADDALGQWYPLLIDELDELKKQSQQDLRRELELPWSNAFIVATSANPEGIDPALRDRFVEIVLLPPRKTELQAWIEDICYKSGITVADPQASAIVVDVTGGHFRKMLNLLQRLRDCDLPLNVDHVRSVAGKMGLR